MRLEEKKINCRELPNYSNSNRTTGFFVAIYYINYNGDDKAFVDKLIERGTALAEKVNPAAANLSGHVRRKERLINNATAGLLAEYCWKKYINDKAGKPIVEYTEFTEASSQIDLITLNTGKLIEVRSSFPRNGVDFAVCHKWYEFDILGPYSNMVKPGEIQKDFYTRTLYHIPSGQSFINLLKSNSFAVYLTGGATWEMMTNNQYSKNKDLLPDDGVSVQEEIQSTYRVVPFSKALDTQQIFDLIKDSDK